MTIALVFRSGPDHHADSFVMAGRFRHCLLRACDVIHIEEVRKAVKQMKCNKASGGDGIPAELYTHGGTTLVRHLHRLFLKIWKNEEVPQ